MEGPLVLVSILLTAVLICVMYFGHKHDEKTNSVDWSLSKAAVFVVPWRRFPRPHIVLPSFRTFAFLYCGSLLIAHSLSFESSDLPSYFSWFTVWSYTLLVVYFLFSSAVSCYDLGFYYTRIVSQSYAAKLFRDPCTDTTRRCLFVLFEVCFVVAMFVDCVTWFVLFPAAKASNDKPMLSNLINFVSYNQHGTNLLLISIDFALNSFPVQPWHFRYLVVWVYSYSCFAWGSHLLFGTEYKYFFLATDSYMCVIAYLGVLGAAGLFWFVAVLLSRRKMGALARQSHHLMQDLRPDGSEPDTPHL